ncbi:PEP-CTERM sorting domain-containing protein [uncultured Sphingomonas sp.]
MIAAILAAAAPAAGRTAPEPSDVALFAVAALAVWFVRRRLRNRFRRKD